MKRTLGVCYYPEQWAEDRWAEDARRMVETGLSWVRIGEFAWSRMEPEPGVMVFDWLDRAIDVLGAAGLKVVLGTPTATPPRWMLERHPDMLAVDAEGRPRKFGSRRHYCFSHDGYREECARIVSLLAERYGPNPHVAAWQTDNEYGCHDTVLSWSSAARDAFRRWLRTRYGTVQTLNEAWGNVFWSMEYRSFDEIDLPNLTVTEANPAHHMAFRRFSSDQVVSFNRLQVDILRAATNAPLIHNYMGRETAFDHFAVGADLDIASWDSYPIGFLSDRLEASDAHKRAFLRQGDPDLQAFHHDLYRRVGKGRMWIMEQQPGPVNWAPYNPAPLPGMARLWAWEAFAHGAETVCYFRWRQAPFAQEQMHAGLQRPNGLDAPAMAEVAQVAKELSAMPDASTAKAKVGLVFDYAAAWAWETQPQGADFDYFRLCFEMYRGLRRLGLSVDIIAPEPEEVEGYDLVLAPGLAELSSAMFAALEACGAHVLLGPRTGMKTPEMATALPEPTAFRLFGARLNFVESLPPEEEVSLAAGGAFRHWFETVEALVHVAERTESGAPSLLKSGRVAYLCGWPDETALDRMIGSACLDAGIETEAMPAALRRRDTATHRVYTNYGAAPIEWRGQTIGAADVAWELL
ncbi:beta-galactosidase [Poseidonocella pacifica]|uniref:Beta-galactosidase n=1 Tax=Poseidonocella pacifica TaxID=871651 RepID=A0A1I0XW68_9RHOB|nr:beta-galactosidase [Poseidonocella pacifica]SFB04907.1 beta-galactosidase [Poseidonocella pacifica]